MGQWHQSTVLADSASLTAGTAAEETIADHKSPVVCVALESLEGAADDTTTIEFVGDAATYQADQRTLSATGTYTVEIPQAEAVQFTSANGVTYSVEVRSDP